MKLATLQRHAGNTARWRGHSLKWGAVYGRADGPKSRNAKCRFCYCELAIHEALELNGIDIGGPAVAVSCEQSRRQANINYLRG